MTRICAVAATGVDLISIGVDPFGARDGHQPPVRVTGGRAHRRISTRVRYENTFHQDVHPRIGIRFPDFCSVVHVLTVREV